MSYVHAIREALPEDGIVVADYTQVGYAATAAFPVFKPRQMITPGYQGTLGFAYATALGAKVGCPDQPVVAICGDGGFLFTANELATAVQHDIRAIAIVFTDGAYGNVRRMQQDLYGNRVVASDTQEPRLRPLCREFRSSGAAGVRPRRPFGGAALGAGRAGPGGDRSSGDECPTPGPAARLQAASHAISVRGPRRRVRFSVTW